MLSSFFKVKDLEEEQIKKYDYIELVSSINPVLTPWSVAFISIGLFLVNTAHLLVYKPADEEPSFVKAVTTVDFLLIVILVQLAFVQIFDVFPDSSHFLKLLRKETFFGLCIDDTLVILSILVSLVLMLWNTAF